MMNDTIVAIATPPGEGGVCIIRLSGSRAIAIASRLFHSASQKPATALQSRRAYFGEIRDPGDDACVDEVLLMIFKAPKSYTCEDVVEINAHGGSRVSEKILQLTLNEGARLAEPGEFTRRAFLNGRLDLSQAEAVADVISAATDAALRTAMAQLQGKLSDRLNAHYDQLLAVLAQFEAAIDFPEEGLQLADSLQLHAQVSQVMQELDRLIQSYRQGRLVREGARVALVGKPNVGKSSLLNALLQEDRAIVTPHPGTTRDTLEERIRVKDIHINIIDSAGLRHHPEQIEEQGIARTLAALETADLALALFDGSTPLDENDQILLQKTGQKPAIAVINKCDLPQKLDTAKLRERFETVIPISAKTGEGIDPLLDEVYRKVVGDAQAGESVIITRERHREQLVHAHRALERVCESLLQNVSEELTAVDLNIALEHLGSLLGKTFGDDLLDEIFNEFCIGK